MGSSLTTATLTVTTTEAITLNTVDRGSSAVKAISGIGNIHHTYLTIPADTETIIYETHGSTIKGSTFDRDFVKYVRMTNKDGVTGLNLLISNGNPDCAWYVLGPGESLLLWDHASSFDAAAADIAEGAMALADIEKVEASGEGAVVDMELYIACSVA